MIIAHVEHWSTAVNLVAAFNDSVVPFTHMEQLALANAPILNDWQ